MPYRVVIAKKADRQLQKLDRATQQLIAGYISKNLDGCDNPRAMGKGLSGNRTGQWRWRVGKYRILGFIDDKIITIFIFKVGHRSEIYLG